MAAVAKANVGAAGYEARPGWLVPGGRLTPLAAVTRPEYAVCVQGADYRRVSVEGADYRRVSVEGADYRRVSVEGSSREGC